LEFEIPDTDIEVDKILQRLLTLGLRIRLASTLSNFLPKLFHNSELGKLSSRHADRCKCCQPSWTADRRSPVYSTERRPTASVYGHCRRSWKDWPAKFGLKSEEDVIRSALTWWNSPSTGSKKYVRFSAACYHITDVSA